MNIKYFTLSIGFQVVAAFYFTMFMVSEQTPFVIVGFIVGFVATKAAIFCWKRTFLDKPKRFR